MDEGYCWRMRVAVHFLRTSFLHSFFPETMDYGGIFLLVATLAVNKAPLRSEL